MSASLHPDLVPYVQERPDGSFLDHPLVRGEIISEVVDSSTLIDSHNRVYASKRESLARAEAEGDWDTYVFLHERPYRAEALEHAQCKGTDYAELVRRVWIDSESISQNEQLWRDLLPPGAGWHDWLMSADERRALAAHADPVRVFRGYSLDDRELGMAWTTDYKRAEWFAHRFACIGGEARVVAGAVAKSVVIAYLLDRGESEIVVLPENVRVLEIVVLPEIARL